MSDLQTGPSDEGIEDVQEAVETQDEAVDLSDLLNLLRETILDHELRLMSVEDFLNQLVAQIKGEIEAEAADGSVNGSVDIQVESTDKQGEPGA